MKKNYPLSISILLIASATLIWLRHLEPAPIPEKIELPAEAIPAGLLGEKMLEKAAPTTGSTTRQAINQLDIIARSVAALPGKSLADAMPLPEATLPLAKSLIELERLADLGDAHAALRLYDEAKCCATLPDMTMSLASMATRPPGHTGASAEQLAQQSQFLQAAKDHVIQLNAFCGSVPSRLAQNLARYQALAEQSGSVPIQLEFLAGESPYTPNFRQKPLRERIVSLQRFERDALGTLHSLIARGNLDAVAMMAAIHATPALHGDLGSLVKEDYYVTAVYDLLYLQAGGRAYRAQYEGFVRNRLPQRLSPARLAQARLEADALYLRYFKSAATTEYASAGSIRALLPAPNFKGSERYPGARICPKMAFNFRSSANAAPTAKAPAN